MRKNINTIGEKDVFLWVNIALVGMASLLFFYYIMMANSITTKNYKAQTLRDKMGVLSEANGLLMAEKLILESPAALVEFAKSSNFVEARSILYIFENRNVAQR
ncbi:MAG: hypothetical protein Q8R55_03815 [Candidatus Taylorbacteria bacterium]|nr:hypothetical protein [Candidatus Taylorbacteria bacterium]